LPGPFGLNYFKLVFQNNQIIGAAMLGEAKDPMLLKFIIQEKKSIPPEISRDTLLEPSFDYEQLFYS
jgi:NAD(P)H-nitrite reductase large subunit